MQRSLLLLAVGIFVAAGVRAEAGEIRGIRDLCLDIKGGGAQGAPVVVWDCHGGRNQQWSYDGPRRAIFTRGGLCLDVRNGGGPGTGVTIWTCKSKANANQRWR